MLHFQTPNALNHFFRYSYTHKSYEALEVSLYGTTYEILHNFVKQCDSESSMKGVVLINPNNIYRIIRQLILNYAVAIYISKQEIVAIIFKLKMLVGISFLNFFMGSITPSTMTAIYYKKLLHRKK